MPYHIRRSWHSRMHGLLIILLGLSSLLIAQPAHAAGRWYVKPAATGTGAGTSWANATTLQDALVNKAVSGDEVWAMQGTYKPTSGSDRAATFTLKNGVAVYGGFAGTETAIGQRNVASNPTILTGDLNGNDNATIVDTEPTRQDNSYHVVTGSGNNTSSTLDGFTITGGNANGTGNTTGGAIANNYTSSVLSLANLTVYRNTASDSGGAMYTVSNATISYSSFSENVASGFGGGAIFLSNSTGALTNLEFRGNKSSIGGAIYINYGGPSLTNVLFSGNWARSPAALW